MITIDDLKIDGTFYKVSCGTVVKFEVVSEPYTNSIGSKLVEIRPTSCKDGVNDILSLKDYRVHPYDNNYNDHEIFFTREEAVQKATTQKRGTFSTTPTGCFGKPFKLPEL